MKKGLFLFSILFFVLFLLPFLASQEDTNFSITGEVTSASLAVTVSVLGGPSLSIISPQSATYLQNESLLLNYTVGGEDSVFYNFDDSTNQTIASPFYFNLSEGSHTLFLYANNTNGTLTSRNVTFFINASKLTLLRSEYNGSLAGNSTDFLNYSYEELQNFTGFVFENTDAGKITFSGTVNLTNDSDPDDNEVDLDTFINLSSNRIELNATGLPNFNTSATLSFYGISLSDPRVLKDGEVCSETECVEVSYTSGTYTFTVPHFTVYTLEETPTSSTGGGSGGGGGGGGSSKAFTVSEEAISLSVRRGETTEAGFIVKNTGTSRLDFSLDVSTSLTSFVKLNETSFSLSAGEEKVVLIDFLAKSSTPPDLYIGKILVAAEGLSKEVLIAFGVDSRDSLFDVKVTIPDKFSSVAPGDQLLANINLFNLGATKRIDATITYTLKDEYGNEVFTDHETLAVETQLSFVKELTVPQYLRTGRYALYISVSYDDQVGSSSVWFFVRKGSFFPAVFVAYIFPILILVAIVVIVYLLLRRHKKKEAHYFEG